MIDNIENNITGNQDNYEKFFKNLLQVCIMYTESSITVVNEYWRKTWPNETVTPKMHLLESHMVDFIKKWKVGLGFYGEQG